ncbi:hypothetical protein TcasGA2_TC031124 [Tribolium castaneum]|uniref:Uncharacterized protein n=1 Tax=Tribolium castaneum TaxID=7070 RepID=A0A139W9C8_TRICA|nr:hypothetical protein TcasGA2_TC031124 [Tribolium castaneum]
MAINNVISLILFVLIVLDCDLSGAGVTLPVTTKCEFLNQTLCTDSKGANCSEIQECEKPEAVLRSR